MLDSLRREVVLHDDRGVEGGEVYLMHRLIYARLWLKHHAIFIASPSLRDVPEAICIPLPEWHNYASAKCLKDFVTGDESAGREAGGEVLRLVGGDEGNRHFS